VAEESEVDYRQRHEIFLLLIVQTGSRLTQPPIQWVPGEKWPERETDHSPSSARVKNTWIYTPPSNLHRVVFNNFTSTFLKVLKHYRLHAIFALNLYFSVV
jgi:hypothetical protein